MGRAIAFESRCEQVVAGRASIQNQGLHRLCNQGATSVVPNRAAEAGGLEPLQMPISAKLSFCSG
jgi:hypothetical protein